MTMFLSFFPQQKFRHTLFLSTPYRHSSSASLQVRFAFAPLPGDRERRILLGSGLLEPVRVNAMNRFPTLPQPTSETRSLLSALSCAVVFILRTFEDPRALSLLSEAWTLPVAQPPLRGPLVLSQCVSEHASPVVFETLSSCPVPRALPAQNCSHADHQHHMASPGT